MSSEATPSGDVGDKRTVDLDFVEGKGLKVAERRIARTKIVHGYPDANVTQLE